MTPTAGHQFDISSVHESCLVAGLTANCDLLGLVEDHLAPHLADFPSLSVADVGLDAQHLWLWYQRLPHRCVVATPAAGHEMMEPLQLQRWSQKKSKQMRRICK